jgi:hypothetical protein
MAAHLSESQCVVSCLHQPMHVRTSISIKGRCLPPSALTPTSVVLTLVGRRQLVQPLQTSRSQFSSFQWHQLAHSEGVSTVSCACSSCNDDEVNLLLLSPLSSSSLPSSCVCTTASLLIGEACHDRWGCAGGAGLRGGGLAGTLQLRQPWHLSLSHCVVSQ